MTKSVLYIDNTMTYGGAILSLKNLLKAIDQQKFSPVVTTGQAEDYLKNDYSDYQYYALKIRLPWLHNRIYQGILSYRIANLFPFKQFVTLGRFVYWLLLHHLPDAIRYVRIGRRHDVALIHLNNILGSQLSGILAAKILNVPCVAHLRDFERNTFITRFYARLIDHHIAISAAIKANLRDLGVPAGKISIVHDALDLDEFRPTAHRADIDNEFQLVPGCLKFGLFGRIVAWKGILEFVEATAEVLQDHDDARAFVVGGAPDTADSYYREVLCLIETLDLQDKIILTGYRCDVAALMASMDLIVHASITAEPFGMVVIEGMALAKPVVATAAGGPLDIVVEGETGLLVPPGDSTALAQAISTLLNDAELRLQMGQRARKRAESLFANGAAARKVEQIYDRLLKPQALAIQEQKLQELK